MPTQNRTRDVVFLSAVRTPIGTYGGSLKDIPVIDLTVFAAKAAIQRANIEPASVQNSVFGNVLYTTNDSIYLGRHVPLKAGCRVETPGMTLNRLCGSGFQAIVSGAQDIILGDSHIALVGGAESMSQAPHAARGLRWGVPMGRSPLLEDTMTEGLRDSYANCTMSETAENLAAKYHVDRAQADEFALRSQMLAKAAWDSGVYDAEVIPVPVTNPKTKEVTEFRRDEHMRPQSTAEGLAKLRPAFRTDGIVTAGNASGIGDGAAALIIAGADAAEQLGVKPLARLVSWAVVGVDPTIMGFGPVPASRAVLAKAGLTLDDMDLIEINEAFAQQVVAVERELGIPRDKLNIHGGAVALSHPLGMSGARITTHLIHALRAGGLRYGLGAACIGGGQGIAVIVEALS